MAGSLPDVDRRCEGRLVVYGTLRSGTGWRERLGVEHAVRPLGACELVGALYDLGWYPGLVLDGPVRGPVVGEVLALLDEGALAVFDEFEGYDPDAPERGEYRRVLVEVAAGAGPPAPAWVYALASVPEPGGHIPGGDWLAHLAVERGARP